MRLLICETHAKYDLKVRIKSSPRGTNTTHLSVNKRNALGGSGMSGETKQHKKGIGDLASHMT